MTLSETCAGVGICEIEEEAGARQLFEEILTQDPGLYWFLLPPGQAAGAHGGAQLAIEWYEKGMAALRKSCEATGMRTGELQGGL